MSLLDSISCTLLPGAFYDSAPVPLLYNAVYESWKKTWREVLIRAGNTPESLDVNNFTRQNIIITLHRRNQILGTATLSIFNSSAHSTYDHPYFKPFTLDLMNEARGLNSCLMLTSEYLTVEPAFRGINEGVLLSEVMIGLIVKTAMELGSRFLFGTAIRAARVDVSCKKFGYAEVGAYYKYGIDCVLLRGRAGELRNHPDETTASWIHQIWATKSNFTTLPFQENYPLPQRRAA